MAEAGVDRRPPPGPWPHPCPGPRARLRSGAPASRRDRRRNSSAPTGSPSRVASRPPCALSSAATLASVSANASAGGSRVGRAAKEARMTSSTSCGSVGSDAAYVEAHRASRRLCARAIRSSSSALTSRVPLEDDHVAGALALEQARAGDLRVQLAGVSEAGDLVVGAADDGGGHPPQHLDVLELVEAGEDRVEVGHDRERGGVEHVVDEVDVVAGHVVAEGVEVCQPRRPRHDPTCGRGPRPCARDRACGRRDPRRVRQGPAAPSGTGSGPGRAHRRWSRSARPRRPCRR